MHAELQLDNQICFRLYTSARLITQAYTPMLTELGITYPQYLVLMVLWEKDCQPVNDIAHRLLLETNTVTPLLQRMEKLGIVTRKKGKQDKRQQIVSLTKKGRDMEEEAYKLIPAGMGETLKACPLQMDDYTHLASELDSIIETLKKNKQPTQNEIYQIMLPSATWSLHDLRRHQSSDDSSSGVRCTGAYMASVQPGLYRFCRAGIGRG